MVQDHTKQTTKEELVDLKGGKDKETNGMKNIPKQILEPL
jgi:hypothetical protein